jgi:hypothetical protein
MKLEANTTTTDHHRAFRLLIAWATGDRFACDIVLQEAMDDPVGVPGLLFTLAEFATDLGHQVAQDFTEQLRAALLRDEG